VQDFTFTLNPFSHTLTKGITVTCDDPTFGITMGNDELNNRAYVADVKRNSSAANMFSSLKATLRKINGGYITNVNGMPVFTKEDAISALRQLHDERVENMTIELALERKMSSQALWKAVAEYNIFQPDAPSLGEHQHGLTVADVRSIAAVRFLDIDFSESRVPT